MLFCVWCCKIYHEMNSMEEIPMKELTKRLISALESGERAVLCTILASSGSSPRGAGARMAVFADGSTVGTVGGGAV